jgi:hypothetical protein
MQSLRHKPRVDFPVKVAVPEPAPRRKKPTVTAIGGPRKKPMLIRNLGGAGTAKSECLDMVITRGFVLMIAAFSRGRHEVESQDTSLGG